MRMYSLRERIEDLQKRVPTADAEAIQHEMYECEGAKVLEELEKRSGGLPQALWKAWHKLWPNIDEHEFAKNRYLHEGLDPLCLYPPELHPDAVKREREKSMPLFWDTVLRLLDANEQPSEASSNLRNQKRGRADNNDSTFPSVNGVQIDRERKKCIYQDNWQKYKSTGIPWRIVTGCLVEGRVAIADLGKTPNEAYKIVSEMNEPWRKKGLGNLFCIDEGYIYLDPERAKQELTPEIIPS